MQLFSCIALQLQVGIILAFPSGGVSAHLKSPDLDRSCLIRRSLSHVYSHEISTTCVMIVRFHYRGACATSDNRRLHGLWGCRNNMCIMNAVDAGKPLTSASKARPFQIHVLSAFHTSGCRNTPTMHQDPSTHSAPSSSSPLLPVEALTALYLALGAP